MSLGLCLLLIQRTHRAPQWRYAHYCDEKSDSEKALISHSPHLFPGAWGVKIMQLQANKEKQTASKQFSIDKFYWIMKSLAATDVDANDKTSHDLSGSLSVDRPLHF